MKMRLGILAFELSVLLAITVVPATAADSRAKHCAENINKVTSCLGYATGKADDPGKPCCNAVGEMKESDPACLCYIIQQTHNGTQQMVKSVGILESRLLQLSSACSLRNASISDCPRLLGIPPTSPDNAIFANTTSTVTTTPTTATTASPGSETPSPDKAGASGLTGVEEPGPRQSMIFTFMAVLSLMVSIRSTLANG